MTVYICERCGAPAEFGVACDPCQIATYDALLASRVWRENASGRRGDIPGESLLATVARERAALCELGGADGARERLRS